MPATYAVDLIGEISTSGTPELRQTIITNTDTKLPIVICPKGRKFELTQLAGSIVTVKGEYRKLKDSKRDCFYAESFEISEIVKGRPAITGKLKMIEKGKYAIIHPSGKIWHLAKLPSGLKELVGKSVVFDLVANDASGAETTWLIARAFVMPEP